MQFIVGYIVCVRTLVDFCLVSCVLLFWDITAGMSLVLVIAGIAPGVLCLVIL
jgi:hypothetical protein